MQTIFSTAAFRGKDRFRLWQDFVQERVGPIEQAHLSAEPFDGLVEALDVGPLRLTRVIESAVQSRVTPATLRRRDEPDSSETSPRTCSEYGKNLCLQVDQLLLAH